MLSRVRIQPRHGNPRIGNELPHRLYRELAVSTRERDQLAASKPLRGATLVGVDVSDVGAHDSVIGPCHCLQAEDIGGGAVENKKDFRVSAEVLSKFFHSRGRVGVITVTNRVAMVGVTEGCKNFRMNTSIIVAGKAANRLHACQCNRAANQQPRRTLQIRDRVRSKDGSGTSYVHILSIRVKAMRQTRM